MNVLIVAAHPDDEILGVGGTILKHRQRGDRIFVCMMTKADRAVWGRAYMKQKEAEQKKVDALLGVTRRFNLNYITTKLNVEPAGPINRRVSQVVDQVKPQVIYMHSGHDLNYDHVVTYRACLVASRPPARIRLLCFETLSATDINHTAFTPTVWVDIGAFLEKKVRVFSTYASEVKKYPHPRSLQGIRVQAHKRGMDVGVQAAEAFMLIREVWRS